MKKPKIIVIVGPTGSGKTALSLLLAKQFDGEVINADSRQVYKGLDIGTEKITQDEMDGVPHHLLDVVSITKTYTAADFKRDAENAIKNILSRGKVPIIAGGTFFYIDTLLGKMSNAQVAPNPELRAVLEQKSTEELFLELKEKDPRRAEAIDKDNKRRLVRALEIIEAIDHVPVFEVQTESSYEALILGLEVDPVLLRTKLRTRAEAALTKGLVEETKKLLGSGVSKERLLEIGHEYKLVLTYLDGTITDAELIQKCEEKNWQYAKRQRMWLKRDKTIEWFHPEDTSAIVSKVTEFLH
ncbi:MAG: tRNA delta(2)-isopentenylpyrophosphate transferase, tRNA dimethylallyltransferase [Candidatus Parcubacteria bacterium]